jgi:hypothetical protein
VQTISYWATIGTRSHYFEELQNLLIMSKSQANSKVTQAKLKQQLDKTDGLRVVIEVIGRKIKN